MESCHWITKKNNHFFPPSPYLCSSITSLSGHLKPHGSYSFSTSKVECSLPSSVHRERAGRCGEEGEAVVEEEGETGDQSRQDGEQSSGESTPAAANLPLHQGNPLFPTLCLEICSSDSHPEYSRCLNCHRSGFIRKSSLINVKCHKVWKPVSSCGGPFFWLARGWAENIFYYLLFSPCYFHFPPLLLSACVFLFLIRPFFL